MNTRTDSDASHRAVRGLDTRGFLRLVFSALVALIVVGCGGSESQLDRKPVFGKIVGAEGKNGAVTFTPINSSSGPSAMTDFQAGAYRFTRDNGPTPGEHRISIEVGASLSQEDMPKHLRGSRPPTVVYEPVDKTINISVPAEGPLEIDLDFGD